MKKILFITMLVISSIGQFMLNEVDAKPLMAIAKIGTNSPRAMTLASILTKQINNITNLSDVFDNVNTEMLNSELSKFNCLEEKCILRFAADAEIDVVIIGEIDDMGDYLMLRLQAYGAGVPFHGKIIYSYSVKIPLQGQIGVGGFYNICEEHAGHFTAKTLLYFKQPLFFKATGKPQFSAGKDISGTFDLFRLQGKRTSLLPLYKKIATITIKNSSLVKSPVAIEATDFIFLDFKDKHDFLVDFYYGRKKELVFQTAEWSDSVMSVLLTVPASASMPLTAPLFGYYKNNDWLGLGLWALNAAPYLYLEYDGLKNNNPKKLRGDKDFISRDAMTRNRFAWYMLCVGGLPLFVDAFAYQYIEEAASYQEKKPLMGNTLTAAYLSLVSGGAGHFYRGNRFWGYFYFHLNNVLVYLTIREFTSGERYNPDNNSYEKHAINRKKAYTYMGILAGLKLVEVFHAVMLKENISSGKIIQEQNISFTPTIYGDFNSGLTYGMQCGYKF